MAMGLFMTIVVVAVGAYIRVIKTQGIVTDVMAANDNASLVMEQMAREIRTGRSFSVSDAGQSLTLRNDMGNCVLYEFVGSAIGRVEVEQGNCAKIDEYPPTEPLTAPTVVIKDSSFSLSGSGQSHSRGIFFDKVDISFKVDISGEGESGFFAGGGNELKTTVSARKYFQN